LLDPWEGDVSLAEKYPGLFNICHSQEDTFEQVVESNFNVPFRRRLNPELLLQWNNIS
jgi:hypothetical protein